MASWPLLTVSVTTVPVEKLAVPVLPPFTLSPTGLEDTDSPERPVVVKVSATAEVEPPQMLATPPPPQVWGAVQDPQLSVPPQPLEIVPQFFPWAAQVVGVHAAAGFTARIAVTVPPIEAEMVAEVEACTAEVVAVKPALVWPAGTTTLDGTLATALLLERNTPAPPVGAAMFRVTVPIEELPPVTELGFSVSPDTVKVAGVPHPPGTPPPPQVCPKSQPQRIVPPQPSGSVPHPVTSKQVLGAQPAFTVNGLVTGVWPAAEVAPIVTVVCCATDFAAWIVAAPPP